MDSENKSKMLNLIFEAQNAELLSCWKKQFINFPEVKFEQICLHQKASPSQRIDAVLKRWIFPCNKYGILIKRGESLIIDVREYKELSHWIVTTPRLDDKNLSLIERDYLEFKLAFESIKKHNQLNKKTPIKTLIVDIELLYSFRDHIPYHEAERACKAYKEYKQR